MRSTRLWLAVVFLAFVATIAFLHLQVGDLQLRGAPGGKTVASSSKTEARLKKELVDARASAARERQAKRDSLAALEKAIAKIDGLQSDVARLFKLLPPEEQAREGASLNERVPQWSLAGMCKDNDVGLKADSGGLATGCADLAKYCTSPDHGPTMRLPMHASIQFVLNISSVHTCLYTSQYASLYTSLYASL